MRHPLDGRHYVALGRRGLRRHLVMRTVAVRVGRHTKLRYEIAERRFSRRKAERRVLVLNARNGRAH